MVILRPLYIAALHEGEQSGSRDVVTGMAIMFSLLAVAIVGSTILEEYTQQTWDRLRSSAANPVEILFGKAVPMGCFLIVQQFVVIVGGSLLFGIAVGNWGVLVVAILAWTLAVLSLGLALGTVVRSYAQLFAAQDIGGFLLTTVGGALVPLSLFPGWVQSIAPLSPGYWGVTAMRAAMRGDTGTSLRAAVVLLCVTIVFAALSYVRTRSSWKNPIRL